MKKKHDSQYVKRTQRNYSYAFKMQVVREVEIGRPGLNAAQRKYGIQGNATVKSWLLKYGSLDWESKSNLILEKSSEQKLLELEAKVRLLEKQKASLKKKLEETDKKVIIFDMMIDIAEEELKYRSEKSPYLNSYSIQD